MASSTRTAKDLSPSEWAAETFRRETPNGEPAVTHWRICTRDENQRTFETMDTLDRPETLADVVAFVDNATLAYGPEVTVKVEARATGRNNPYSQKVVQSPSARSEQADTPAMRMVMQLHQRLTASRDIEVSGLRSSLEHERSETDRLRSENRQLRGDLEALREEMRELKDTTERDETLHHVARGVADVIAVRLGGADKFLSSSVMQQRAVESLCETSRAFTDDDLQTLNQTLGPSKSAALFQLLVTAREAAEHADREKAKRKTAALADAAQTKH